MNKDLERGRDWTFITVTYNSEEVLQRFWRDGPPSGSRWLVVDNASSDATAEVARQLGAEVIELEANRGFGAANNVGLREATSRYVCFANPDVTVDPESLEAISYEIDHTAGIVAPQLFNSDGSTQANGRGMPLLFSKVMHRVAPNSSIVRSDYHRVPSPSKVMPACWVMGAVVAGTRTLFLELKGWDERFFLYYEDKDLCLRTWKLGRPVHVLNTGQWLHGWARETSGIRLGPWKRELASMGKFYARYPSFLLWPSMARRVNRYLAPAFGDPR